MRAVKRSAMSLLGSANLIHAGLRRMDLQTLRLAIARGDRSDTALHPSQVARSALSTSMDRRISELGRTILTDLQTLRLAIALGKGRAPGNRLRSNRWVGQVKNDRVKMVRASSERS